MRTIYKYALANVDVQAINIPPLVSHELSPLKDQLLKVDAQYNHPFIWVLVDTELEPITRYITIRGTGEDCDELSHDNYIGSFMIDNSEFVYHAFEVIM